MEGAQTALLRYGGTWKAVSMNRRRRSIAVPLSSALMGFGSHPR